MALLETVWLRRESAEFLQAQAIAAAAFNPESAVKSLAQLSDTMFPWLGKLRARRESKMREIMHKWTSSGRVEFKVPSGRNPLRERAKQMLQAASTEKLKQARKP